MKLSNLVLLLIIAVFKVSAQQHNPNDQIISRQWNIIGGVSFKVVKNQEMYAVYTNEIKKYANKSFELEGYMIPIQEGMKQSKFMLSTLPINQCFFCGKNGIPAMVYVELLEPTKFTYNTVRVKGILKLSVSNAMDYPPIVLVNGLLK
ncbi:hypothetical protein IWX76_000611 [Pedobacter sp. CAN_A7]|uniref:hypothetical protein n=1 Tax=Pedobacter sp. CAN_A7 TaxID=2787722 RepID=UPI0018C93986